MLKRLLAMVSSVLLLGALVAGGLNLHANVAASPSVHAFASGPISVELRDLQGDPLNGPIMSANDMAPGDTHIYTASVANTSLFPLQYNVGLVRTDLQQAGTFAQVTRNDALGSELLLMVERLDGPSESDPTAWTSIGVHTLNEWTSGAVTPISPVLFGGQRHKFRFTVDFPLGAGDAAQAGTIAMELQIHAQGVETPPPLTPGQPPAAVDFTVTKHVGLDPLVDSGKTLLTFDATGGTAYFHYSLKNTGGQTITIASAVDDQLGAVSFDHLALSPGESANAVGSKVYASLAVGAPADIEVGVVTVKASDVTRSATASVKRTSQAQPLPTTGTLTVAVLRQAVPNQPGVPLPGAAVQLSNGLSGTTGGDGTVLFLNQPLDVPLTVTASAGNSKPPEAQTVTLTKESPDLTVILLVSDEPLGPSLGSLVVRVVDRSEREGGKLVPIKGAFVQLSNGLYGTTDANGQVFFEKIVDFQSNPTLTLEAQVWALDPKNPVPGTRKEARMLVTLTPGNNFPTLTLPLQWEPTPGPIPAAEPAPQPGALTGRVCSPKPPGSRIRAVGPDGQSAEVTIAPNGSLGQWRPWIMSNLTTGLWTVTIDAPDGMTAQQQVLVKGGLSTSARDFTLACTGEPTDQAGKVIQVAGATMLLGGLVLLGWRRRHRRPRVS